MQRIKTTLNVINFKHLEYNLPKGVEYHVETYIRLMKNEQKVTEKKYMSVTHAKRHLRQLVTFLCTTQVDIENKLMS